MRGTNWQDNNSIEFDYQPIVDKDYCNNMTLKIISAKTMNGKSVVKSRFIGIQVKIHIDNKLNESDWDYEI